MKLTEGDHPNPDFRIETEYDPTLRVITLPPIQKPSPTEFISRDRAIPVQIVRFMRQVLEMMANNETTYESVNHFIDDLLTLGHQQDTLNSIKLLYVLQDLLETSPHPDNVLYTLGFFTHASIQYVNPSHLRNKLTEKTRILSELIPLAAASQKYALAFYRESTHQNTVFPLLTLLTNFMMYYYEIGGSDFVTRLRSSAAQTAIMRIFTTNGYPVYVPNPSNEDSIIGLDLHGADFIVTPPDDRIICVNARMTNRISHPTVRSCSNGPDWTLRGNIYGMFSDGPKVQTWEIALPTKPEYVSGGYVDLDLVGHAERLILGPLGLQPRP